MIEPRGYHGRRELSLRPVRAADAERLHPLMLRSFANAWTLQQVRRFVRGDDENTGGIVAVEQDPEYCGPAGFLLYEWHNGRAGWEILSLAVEPRARRRGVASQMLQELKEPLHKRGCREHLTAIVGEGNLAAQLLFRQAGFYLAGVRRGHFRSATLAEDGYVFAYDRLALRLANLWPQALRQSGRRS